MIRGLILFFISAFLVLSFQNCSEAEFASIPDRHYIDESLNDDGLNDGAGDVVTDDGSGNVVNDDGASNGEEDGGNIGSGDGDSNSDSGSDSDDNSDSNTDGDTNNDSDGNSDSDSISDTNTPGTVGSDVDGDGDHDSVDDELEYACGNSRKDHKVLICHVPKGNIENRHNICIAKKALKAHIDKHGADGVFDYFGECID